GIRDPLVTGVQTCALPIWRGLRSDEQAVAVEIVSPECVIRRGSSVEGNVEARLLRGIQRMPMPTAGFDVEKLPLPAVGKAVVNQIGRASCRERVKIREEAG